ncbi:MAG: MarR family winged helix-turn-helix transcriptional regulator, partial [Bacillus sp. (in: firmicutes)]
ELNKQLAKHDLFSSQWSILYMINMNETASLIEISNYMYVEKPTITRTINRLEELNYVEAIAGKDKREKRMQLTPLGKQIYAEVRQTLDQFEENIMLGIPLEEQQRAIRILAEVRKNIIQ